ncbi:MAG: hypothetical protein IJ890_08800 [Clostridia bacterium]|nr:hypothetical protein [Clostridia bacterium]
MPIIITPGIILPDGRFLPNSGDGHRKNATRYCEKYPKLDELRLSTSDDADDFMITAGCAIVASYRGKLCFKIAQDNEEEKMEEMKKEYEKLEEVIIETYWTINPEYKEVLNEIVKNTVKMQISIRRQLQWKR